MRRACGGAWQGARTGPGDMRSPSSCRTEREARARDAGERLQSRCFTPQRDASGARDPIVALTPRDPLRPIVLGDFLQPALPDQLLERPVERRGPEAYVAAAQLAHVVLDRRAIARR